MAWEAEAQRAATLGMRVALVRTGIVLGRDGGALAALLPLFRAGLGGVVASGAQWYSWIHIEDQVGIYLHAIDRAEGALNATAPHPVTNRDFTRALAAAVHRPALFPVPAFALGLLLGEGAVVVTEGQRVLPERTLASGYTLPPPRPQRSAHHTARLTGASADARKRAARAQPEREGFGPQAESTRANAAGSAKPRP